MGIRYLSPQVKSDLSEKMVFLGGPRQVGKTTLAQSLLENDQGYLNWDAPLDREKILQYQLPLAKLWVFDEIHKYKKWRNYLKGLYDREGRKHQILVTGSARLDLYRYGGDSLQGRYHYLRLHPLSVAELKIQTQKDFLDLLNLGGFPEPFFKGSEVKARRWSKEYRSRLIHDEVNSLERVEDLGQLELMVMRLPKLVGSPLSINALREDLQMSFKTIKRWLAIMERLYGIFRISPFGAPKIKAVKKEQKHYHFDWNLHDDEGQRFENFVACHLLKWVHYIEDVEGRDLELRYFRDVYGKEVDFVVCEKLKPILMVECKWKDTEVSSSLKYLKTKFPLCEAWQITALDIKEFITRESIHVAPAVKFLQNYQ